MMTCPNCHAGFPEGMRFCLECGASLTPLDAPAAPYVEADPPMPAAPMAPPTTYAEAAPLDPMTDPPHLRTTTVPLKIAPTPVMAPRAGAAAEHTRPSLGDQMLEIDDESLKKSFERRITHPGAVVCRFCKGPLDLAGDFCETCGAPVTEAAPPGTIQPKPQPAAPPVSATPAPPPSKPAQAAPPARPPAGSAPAHYPNAATATPAKPAARRESTPPTPTRTPAPVAPASPPAPPAEEQPAGLMGRLKGLFKKG